MNLKLYGVIVVYKEKNASIKVTNKLLIYQIGPPIWVINEPGAASTTYDVIVSTGINPRSGTTAKITMVIYGSLGNSGPLKIQVVHNGLC